MIYKSPTKKGPGREHGQGMKKGRRGQSSFPKRPHKGR